MANAARKTTHCIGGTQMSSWVSGNVIGYLRVLLHVISAMKNMLLAATQSVPFQISDTLHMKNKAFYLLCGRSCFAVLIKPKPADAPGTGFITSELGRNGL